ncbi:hypothetical protein PTSG_03365 [Salpingoeca rosetta]|uniref:JmjC domain-containing protein n=1 Tax=Salpingoeca rosetta (strain ATCC 50818 / BSB-021) TaxID=946362 RepID=F2U4Y8_SALR5|nr:uncharacterized protein PTSG_03365 [Salpingoeca rosetta]EGD82704.1 hypothetical protein PTSG_03365 [Salpingoeca rosetta]|eukprot:XP_004995940.1 hypothetical protein PTSG_03365 [Salpingoeca rosetta]
MPRTASSVVWKDACLTTNGVGPGVLPTPTVDSPPLLRYPGFTTKYPLPAFSFDKLQSISYHDRMAHVQKRINKWRVSEFTAVVSLSACVSKAVNSWAAVKAAGEDFSMEDELPRKRAKIPEFKKAYCTGWTFRWGKHEIFMTPSSPPPPPPSLLAMLSVKILAPPASWKCVFLASPPPKERALPFVTSVPLSPLPLPAATSATSAFVDDLCARVSPRGKGVLFATNIDLCQAVFTEQLQELSDALPDELHWRGGSTMLAELDPIEGINSPQMFIHLPGTSMTARQENNNLMAININVGPGSCVWYGVAPQHVGRVKSLCKKKGIDFKEAWWPTPGELDKENIPLVRFIQGPGEAVLVNPGTLHWVRALSACVHVSWNLAPACALQYVSMFGATYHIVPRRHLARCVLLREQKRLPRDAALCAAMLRVVTQDLEEHRAVCADKTLVAVACEPSNAACFVCGGDVGNAFFTSSPSKVFCVKCRNTIVARVRTAARRAGTGEVTAALMRKTCRRAFGRSKDAANDDDDDPTNLLKEVNYFLSLDELAAIVERTRKRLRSKRTRAERAAKAEVGTEHMETVREWFSLTKRRLKPTAWPIKGRS